MPTGNLSLNPGRSATSRHVLWSLDLKSGVYNPLISRYFGPSR